MRTNSIKYLLLILSFAGFILFFPVHFSDDECCLGDTLSPLNLQYTLSSASHHGADDLLHRYVFPFGLFWWTSIALGFWSLKQLITQRTRKKYEQSAH